MALQKIEEITLYMTYDAEETVDTMAMISKLDNASIPYARLVYISEQKEDVLASVNTWWNNTELGNITAWPFVTYTEVHDDRPARQSPVLYATLSNVDDFITKYQSVNA